MFQLFFENIRIAVSAIFSSKLRSFLTALGIIIGVLAVTLMGTLISGLDKSFEKSMSMLGKDVFFISKFEWFGNQDYWELRNRPEIKPEYAEKLVEQGKYVIAASSQSFRMSEMSRDEKNITGVSIVGTTTDYMQTSNTTIEKGRFITQGENNSGSRVAVIGYDVAEELFENFDPIGEDVKIGPYKFRVVGIIEKQGKFLGLQSMDNQAIIPLGTFQRLFSRRGHSRMAVKVDKNNMEEAEYELRSIMRRLRGLRPEEPDNFAINKQEAFETTYNSIKLAIGGTGIFITVLSLIVGGIGIMNIMFVSVKERTREIGIRKAIGATRNVILSQFLIEAVLICLMGGLTGLGFAYALSFVINQFLPSTMPVSLAILAVIISLTVGIVSGLVPAYRAAKLDPIEALSYD
ncbi:MAG: ABC transporter permease [Candidatus Marinimicrobia bacterium]|nr:ABC transporter permease [Candidatus Neomarinimicrobiota bacterium]